MAVYKPSFADASLTEAICFSIFPSTGKKGLDRPDPIKKLILPDCMKSFKTSIFILSIIMLLIC